jgi:hypothetical protein
MGIALYGSEHFRGVSEVKSEPGIVLYCPLLARLGAILSERHNHQQKPNRSFDMIH